MILFIRYVLNYRLNVRRIAQLKDNLENIHGKQDFQLIMARAAAKDLWNNFRSKK